MEMETIDYIHIELSTLCNASCPCCPRYLHQSPIATPALNLGYITIEDFKQWFPSSILKRTKLINFCGNHGDPGTNPDLPKILNYLKDFTNFRLQIHTNGGMKNSKFWREVARECKTHTKWEIIFSIDGLQDTNHLYRRNVKWDKLLDNIKAVSAELNKDGNFKFTWEYLVFSHNEHQLEEAKKISKDLGFTSIEFKRPLNVDDGVNLTPVAALDVNGEVTHWIEATTLPAYRPPYISKNAKKVYQTNLDKFGGYSLAEAVKRSKHTPVEEVVHVPRPEKLLKMDEEVRNVANNSIIKPLCKKQEFYIETSGQVHKCCYIATGYDVQKASYDKKHNLHLGKHQYVEKLSEMGNKLNLNTNTLENIIEEKLMQKIYDNNWNKSVEEGKLIECANTCGKLTTYKAHKSIFTKDII